MCVLKTCTQCGKEFKADRYSRQYCSRKCYGLSSRLTGPCTICGVKHARKRPSGNEAWYNHPKTGKTICDNCYGVIPRKGLCIKCGRTESTRWSTNEKGTICRACTERYRTSKVKLEVLTHYSKRKPVCCKKNCDVEDIDMLALDHIKDDGPVYRKKIGNASGYRLYDWVKRNNFPKIFQVMCWNHIIKKDIEKSKRNF